METTSVTHKTLKSAVQIKRVKGFTPSGSATECALYSPTEQAATAADAAGFASSKETAVEI